ncbi:unnamed protein product [Prunus brigantina]
MKYLTLVTEELRNNVSITTPNVVAAAGVGGSIFNFYNMRKVKEQQKQLDENVKSLTLVTEELRNVTRELNKSTRCLIGMLEFDKSSTEMTLMSFINVNEA